MGKFAKNSEPNAQNRNKRLVDTHFQRMQQVIKNRDNNKKELYVNGDFGVKRKTAVLKVLESLTFELDSLKTESAAENLVAHELIPFVNYHSLDYDCDLRIGAALWILDKLRISGKLNEAYRILPNVGMDLSIWYLPHEFYHPCYSNDLINSVIHVITHRYPQGGHSGCIISLENAKGIPPSKIYTQLMELLPKTEVSQACRIFKEKLYELSLRYVKGESYYERELKAVDEALRNTCKTALSTFESSSFGADKINDFNDLKKADIFTQDAVRQGMLGKNNDYLCNFTTSRVDSLFLRRDKLAEQKREYFFNFDRYLQLDKKEVLEESGIQEIADCTDGFFVSDPYELCFALFYLLDTGDDAPWLMVSGYSLMKYADRMLPWYVDQSEWETEDFDVWFEGLYYNRNDWIKQGPADEVDFYHIKHGDKNLAQVIYDLCRTVVPTGMHPFEKDRMKFIKEGMDENLAQRVTDMAELLFLYNFQFQKSLSDYDYSIDEDSKDSEDSDINEDSHEISEIENKHTDTSSTLKFQSVPKIGGYWGRELGISDNEEIPEPHESADTQQPLQDVNSLKEEISALKQQVKSLNKTLAVSRREQFNEKVKYEQELKTLRLEHRELADLREIIFNQNDDPDAVARREIPEKSYSYPYTTKKRTVIFGGHDSWLKAIKPMLPDCKFVDVDQYAFNQELIRNADVVWIQTNCMSHAQFSNVIGRIRQYGILVRYFGYSSAEKCAEQLVTEDLTQDKKAYNSKLQ